jgi:hypothetical protein
MTLIHMSILKILLYICHRMQLNFYAFTILVELPCHAVSQRGRPSPPAAGSFSTHSRCWFFLHPLADMWILLTSGSTLLCRSTAERLRRSVDPLLPLVQSLGPHAQRSAGELGELAARVRHGLLVLMKEVLEP